ncbi:MAG: transposase [Myxococcales bacterium]|nr:transposase [Myxococcales bacterium]
MARIARAVFPGLPHHVTQRGNRRQLTFLQPGDYRRYFDVLAYWCWRYEVEIWAWCLMPNHGHLIAVPETADGLRWAIGETHRQYSLEINRREGWTGYLWQGRFSSYVMDPRHTLAAARYIELNPVRAGLVTRPEEYQWSSARAHLSARDDGLVRVAPLLELRPDWEAFLASGLDTDPIEDLRKHQRTGRPLGNSDFVTDVERALGRKLRPDKRGPPPRRS